MKRLFNLLNMIIKKRKELKRWQRIVMTLAAMITFVTTYALILPAITVERDNTEEVGGMYLEQEEPQDDLLEENALPFTGVSIAADRENAVTYEYTSDDMTATAVFSTDEEIPEGAELVVSPVDTESEEYADLSGRAVALLDREFVYDVTTCSFYNYALICDGVDVTPQTGLVDVQINFMNNTVEHVNDVVYAGRFGRAADATEGFAAMSASAGYTAETADAHVDTAVAADNDLTDSVDISDVDDELVSSNPDESSAIELNDSIITVLSLKGNDLALTDNVVGILAGNVDEEAKAAAAETDAEIPDYDVSLEEDAPQDFAEADVKAVPIVRTLKAAGNDYTVVLTYDETSGIPDGAKLTASEIAQDSKEYQTYLKESKCAMGLAEDETLPGYAARFFDIKIMVGDEEFTPESGVSVEITYAEPLAENPETEVSAVHFADNAAKAEVIEANASEVRDDGASTVEFTAESFSVYGVIYTVDFHWEVNGKTYKFALSGGDSVSFRRLIDVLGVTDGEADLFFNDIEKVEFSDESLVKVVPITEDVTAGELKRRLGLEIEYSAELTEEQIAEMDANKFTSPDWALLVLKHFDTEELLTATMKDGAVWTIKVTDPVTDTAPNQMQVLPTVDTRSQGVKMWLFDYDIQGYLDHQDNKANQLDWNIPNTYDNAHKYRNYGINSGSDLKFLGWGAGNDVKAYDSSGNTGFGINDFTGLDEGSTNRIRALQGIVKNELVDNYPVLQDGSSLNYLFDPTLTTADRAVYGGTTRDSGYITGLFELKDGYYTYDSDEHYAQLGRSGNNYTNNFTVYTSTLAQTNKNGGNHNPKRAVGFFPFDSYAHVYNDLKYDNNPNLYDESGTLYLNPDGDQGKSGLNHHLGVAMEMDFIMPKDGKTADGDPIQFRFSGDDDMWVFIDDQLVLDIGGLHQPVDGVIDFSTGKATITGKATVAQHSDNTGSAAIGVVQNVTNNRGNNFEFYQSLGLTGGDGKTHTMRIFYLERGGCDSNCMISFNFPLVKGKGEVEVAKYDGTASPAAPLSGVKFGIYTDPQCRDLIEEVTSSSTGILDFSELGIQNDDQKYYIKETKPLPGYKPNDTVYTLKVEDDGSNGYTFGVYVYNEEGVYNNKIDTIGDQPARPVIYNEERKPIDLTVEKVWQKPTMETFMPTEDDDLSATFKVQRYVRSEGERVILDTSQPVTFNVYRIKGSNTTQLYSTQELKGGEKVYVNWVYKQTYVDYNYSDRYNKYKYNTTGGNYLTKSGTGPLEITLPESGTANLYIRDEDFGTQYGNGVTSITVDGTPYNPQNTTEPISTDWEPDNTYNNDDDCPELTLPEDKIDEDHPWKGKFSNLPLYKTEGDITYYYKYYIIEVDPIEGYERIYVDGDGQQIGNPSSLATVDSNASSPQKIINRRLMDIPVEKEWPDYDEKDEYTWTAKFQLDYRNMPLDGGSGQEPSGDEEGHEGWTLYEPATYVEISKGDAEQKFFEDLPMYYTDSNGVTWRREYSVREVEYYVWELDERGEKKQPAIIYKNAQGEMEGFEYTLWYRQEAGEDYNNDGVYDETDYEMSVVNMLAHRKVEEEISLNIAKNWPEGTSYAASENAKAKFRLRRYVVEEYRNYENVDSNASWVDITLVTGNGSPQTLCVPQGQNMFIRGYVKGGTKNQNLTFSSNVGDSIPAYSYDNSANPNQREFVIPFTADITKTITLVSGAEFVSGGIYGIHLSDTNDVLAPEVDNTFSMEFELNNSNEWHKPFAELPVVEVVKMNDGLTATTFMYSYFFEEIECVPETFYAVFTDSDGKMLLGDESNRIIFTANIAANNLPIGFDILKVDIQDNSRKLPEAEFTLRKLDEDEELHYPVPSSNGTFTGETVGTAETDQENGKITFEGLQPGYYEVSETKAPYGYVLLDDAVFYVKVEKTGDVKLLKKQMQDETVTWVEAEPEELVGKATLASSISPAGKAIAITVRNEPGAALPHTGGPGTNLIYLLGLMLAGIAGAGLVMRKRRYIR